MQITHNLNDPDVAAAGLVGTLVTVGRGYVSGLSPNAFFILNHIFVYQVRFWNFEIAFGVLFVALIAVSVPLNPEGGVRQYVRDLAYMSLYLCSAALVWTAFFPGIAYGTTTLWENFGLIYFGVVTAMFLAFWDWRRGILRQMGRALRGSDRAPFRRAWLGLREPRPAASFFQGNPSSRSPEDSTGR